MKPLKQNYKVFVLLGICPSAEPTTSWIKTVHIFLSIFCFTILSSILISSILFCVKNFTSDLPNAIVAVIQIVAAVTSIYSLIIAHFKRDDIKKIFDDFQTIYDESKYF